MRQETFKSLPVTEITCDICGGKVEKEYRHTVRGKRNGEDVIWDFHNSCIVDLLDKYLVDKDDLAFKI